MNKQQLANKIWESANRMRSKIEANEYKDYILGFIFYKFLSDKEVDRLKKDGYGEDDIREYVHENNPEVVAYCQQELGYFIAYDNLFSTWLAKGNSFTVDNVRTAPVSYTHLAEPDIAEELGFLPWYDGARIGAAYTPPSEAQPPSAEDIALDMLAEHEARLCMLELTTTAAT